MTLQIPGAQAPPERWGHTGHRPSLIDPTPLGGFEHSSGRSSQPAETAFIGRGARLAAFALLLAATCGAQSYTISTFAGTSFDGDGGPATSAQLSGPTNVAVDSKGNIYIADGHRIRKVDTSGTISTFAGNGTPGFSGDGGPATAARLTFPTDVAS